MAEWWKCGGGRRFGIRQKMRLEFANFEGMTGLRGDVSSCRVLG